MGSSINMDELKELERALHRNKTSKELLIILYTIVAFIFFILFLM